jgi:cupin fold WbuC family metalloprotein
VRKIKKCNEHNKENSNMKLIDVNLLNQISEQAKTSPRLRMNYNFHQSSTDAIQRMLNALEPKTYLRPHRHPDREEVFLLLRGKAGLLIFDEAGNVKERKILTPAAGIYGVEIPPMVWHTLLILESITF